MRSALAFLVGVAVLLGAPSADAAQRYAAPGGSGSACSQPAPCSLQEAVGKAGTNDEVIVTGGTYALSAPVEAPLGVSKVYIHGDFSAPMPRISGAFESALFRFEGPGERYSYLDIFNQNLDAVGLLCYGAGSAIERVRTTAIGEYATAVVSGSMCKVDDSLIRSEGKGSVALSAPGGSSVSPESALARNVTAVAKGTESIGILSTNINPVSGGSMTLDLKNAIASGDGYDLVASGIFGPSHIIVTNSNFDSSLPIGEETNITGGQNQTAPPQFVDAGSGDYREAPGSPTIDAGSTDQIGALDLDGNTRNQGAAPDIGAFELAPPPPPVTAIESLSVTPKVFRAVNAGGAIFSSKRRPHGPVGTAVSFALSRAATVDFSVERAVKGRRAGKRCAKRTKSNRDHKKCTLFTAMKGGFTDSGAAGQNRFQFSGRIGGKALKPGSYRLVGGVGASVKRALFRVVR